MRIPGIEAEIEGAIFDFDGTLMDSMPDWAGKMLHLLQAHGVAYPPDVIRTITPLGDTGAADYFIHQLGLRMTLQEIRRELDAYALPRYRDTIQPKPGVQALLQTLQQAGVRLCILTASPQHMIRPCLARTGLAPYFRFAWCCDDLGLKKTQPQIYEKTCAALQTVPGRTLFFDDNLLALTTASAAGLAAVGVWDASSAGDEAAIRAVTCRYLHRWPELLAEQPGEAQRAAASGVF